MKTLLLIRHATSGLDDTAGSDRFRPLDTKGERELARMAARCAEARGRPDLMVSSPAVRALATARAMAQVLGYRADDIRVDDRLYAGSAQGLMSIITGLDDSLDQVAIVGHNPELSDLGRHLAADIVHLPTCAIAARAFDEPTWPRAVAGKAILARLDAPWPAAARPQ